jgi:hypothetical protein
MDGLRLMVFYDGSYFKQGQIYFRYRERRGWINVLEFHRILERYVAAKVAVSPDLIKVIAAHYYDGRPATKGTTPDQLEKDRDFELVLLNAGITTHYLPLLDGPKGGAKRDESKPHFIQKGVDVQLAVDVLDLAHADRYDVAVLVTGDADFLPVARRIASLKRQVLLAYFEFDAWDDDKGFNHRASFVSRALVEAANWSLDLVRWVDEPALQKETAALFVAPGPGG